MKTFLIFGIALGIVAGNLHQDECPPGQHRVRVKRGDAETDSLKQKIISVCVPIGESKTWEIFKRLIILKKRFCQITGNFYKCTFYIFSRSSCSQLLGIRRRRRRRGQRSDNAESQMDKSYSGFQGRHQKTQEAQRRGLGRFGRHRLVRRSSVGQLPLFHEIPDRPEVRPC